MSLLDELKIHELIRNVRIYNSGLTTNVDFPDDEILDFLVNDVKDVFNIPDSVYDSRNLVKYPVSEGLVEEVESQIAEVCGTSQNPEKHQCEVKFGIKSKLRI